MSITETEGGKIWLESSPQVPGTSTSQEKPPELESKTIDFLANKITEVEKLADRANATVQLIYQIAIGGKYALAGVALGLIATFLGFLLDMWNDYDKYTEIQEENVELKKRIDELQDELEQVETLTDQLKTLTGDNSIESKFQRTNNRLSNMENSK